MRRRQGGVCDADARLLGVAAGVQLRPMDAIIAFAATRGTAQRGCTERGASAAAFKVLEYAAAFRVLELGLGCA